MEKIIEWLCESNRYKHLLGGFILGLLCNTWYCALLLGSGVGAALEFKDYQHGSKPDIIDALLTFGGCVTGYAFRCFTIAII